MDRLLAKALGVDLDDEKVSFDPVGQLFVDHQEITPYSSPALPSDHNVRRLTGLVALHSRRLPCSSRRVRADNGGYRILEVPIPQNRFVFSYFRLD